MQAALAKGRPPPAWSAQEPPLGEADGFFLLSFGDLSTCRTFGFAMGPIPWVAIVEYADRAGLLGQIHTGFVRVIREMDQEFLDWHEAEAKRERKMKGNRDD